MQAPPRFCPTPGTRGPPWQARLGQYIPGTWQGLPALLRPLYPENPGPHPCILDLRREKMLNPHSGFARL